MSATMTMVIFIKVAPKLWSFLSPPLNMYANAEANTQNPRIRYPDSAKYPSLFPTSASVWVGA